MTRIEDLVLAAGRAAPDRTAVRDADGEMSHAALAATADRVSLALDRARIGADEPVAVIIANRASDVAGFLGIWRAGGVAVPIHQNSPRAVRTDLIDRTGARLLVDAAALDARADAPARRTLPDGAGLIIFTSGSTGAPKGVVLSAERLADKLDMIAGMLAWRSGLNSLVPLQLTFAFGQWVTWLTLTRGGTVSLVGRFDPAAIAHQLLTAGIDRLGAVPTMLRRLPDAAGDWRGQFLSGGEPLPAALGRDLRRRFPAAGIADIFGLTETGTSDFFVRPNDYDQLAGTIGHAGTGIEHRIADDGELAIRSPWRMLGYLDDPDLTADAMPDGWFRTGDLVRQRADGALNLIGRSKDLVVRAGNKIAPLEIEALFLDHPDIGAALAAGIPDPARGEALHLAVVATPGHSSAPDDLRAWAAERIERHKLPDQIHVMRDLPSGSTGKADRGAFRRWLAEHKRRY